MVIIKKYWRYSIFFIIPPFILFYSSKSSAGQFICSITGLQDRVQAEFRQNSGKTSKWKILDAITTQNDIQFSDTCFADWVDKKLKNISDKKIKSYRINNVQETKLLYAPASNYGYARVFIHKEKEGFRVYKESFYFDIKGRVFPNELFFIELKSGVNPNFFQYSYENGLTERKNKFCMRCHQEKSNNNFLFKKYESLFPKFGNIEMEENRGTFQKRQPHRNLTKHRNSPVNVSVKNTKGVE